MSDIAVNDAEMIAAFKLLRGDGKKLEDCITKDFSNELAQKIISTMEVQAQTSALQNAQIVNAIQEQTSVLKNLTEILQKKQKTTVVVVNKDDTGRSVASTAAESMSVITEDSEDAEVIGAVAAAATATQEATKALPSVVKGPWGFVESDAALERRNRIEKSSASFKFLPKDIKKEDIPADAFAPITNDHIVDGQDALFGQVTKSEDDTCTELAGDSFGKYWQNMRIRTDQYGKLKAPKWSASNKETVRSYLPKLSIDGKTKIKLDSGVYFLTVKYENPHPGSDNSKAVEAAIIIGEISFDCHGTVMAPGADWKKLMNGKPLVESTAAKPKWFASKVSEPWKNGDVLKFKIDTNQNSVGFTVKGPMDKEARSGWMFKNVLSLTNNKTYRDHLQIFAYCGGATPSILGAANAAFDGVKFTVLNMAHNEIDNISTVSSISMVEESEGEEAQPAEATTESEETPSAEVTKESEETPSAEATKESEETPSAEATKESEETPSAEATKESEETQPAETEKSAEAAVASS